MAKTEVKPNSRQDRIFKVMYTDKEPPQDYIWGHPDGFYYRYEDGGWTGYDSLDQIKWGRTNCKGKDDKHSCNKGSCCCNDWIDSEKLKESISKLRKELITRLLKASKDAGNSNAVIEFVRDLAARLEVLENSNFLTEADLSDYATKEWVLQQFDTSNLTDRVSSLEGNVDGLISLLQALTRRVETLENNPAPTVNVPTKLSQLQNDVGYISNVRYYDGMDINPTILSDGDTFDVLNSVQIGLGEGNLDIIGVKTRYQLDVPSYNDTEIRTDIQNNALVTSASLNDLNDRVKVVEHLTRLENS